MNSPIHIREKPKVIPKDIRFIDNKIIHVARCLVDLELSKKDDWNFDPRDQ